MSPVVKISPMGPWPHFPENSLQYFGQPVYQRGLPELIQWTLNRADKLPDDALQQICYLSTLPQLDIEQARILAAIVKFLAVRGYAPTIEPTDTHGYPARCLKDPEFGQPDWRKPRGRNRWAAIAPPCPPLAPSAPPPPPSAPPAAPPPPRPSDAGTPWPFPGVIRSPQAGGAR